MTYPALPPGGSTGATEARRTYRIEIAPKTMGLILLVLGLGWLLIQLFPVVLVVVVALFLVGTLNPTVEWLERHGIKRGWGIAIAFTGMSVGVLGLCLITLPSLVDQIRTIADKEPEARNRLAELLSRSHLTAPLANSLYNLKYDALIKSSAGSALEFSKRAVEIIAYCFSAVFLALYMMIDRTRLRGALFAVVPRHYHVRTARILLNLEAIVGGYIRGQALTSALMAGFVFIVLLVSGAPGAVAIAVFAGIADVLPYVGVFLSVGVVLAAVASKGALTAAIVLAVMLTYEEFESRYLIPRIYGRRLRLSSSVVLVALLAGGTLAGIAGALFALPVAAAIRMLIEELRVALPGERIADAPVQERDAKAEREYEGRAGALSAEDAAGVAIAICNANNEASNGAGVAIEETAARLSRSHV
jgi:predicted PurR-regulated permease PerM